MEYNNEELEIIKRAVEDYDLLEKEINKRIDNGDTISDLYDYLRHLASCDITYYEDNYEDYSCIDFNYCDMSCTICEDVLCGTQLHLSKSVELWNDKELYVISEDADIDELKNMLKERGVK